MMKMKNKISTIAFVLLAGGLLSSFTNANLNPSIVNSHLFKIARSKDANEIFYDINVTQSGKLNIENPVQVYWIKYADKGQKESLTWIQDNYAYGLKFLKATENEAKFQFVSYDKRTFLVQKDQDGVFKVFTLSEKKLVAVNRIFIQIDGGTFWFPKISKVELHATDAATEEEKVEIIIP